MLPTTAGLRGRLHPRPGRTHAQHSCPRQPGTGDIQSLQPASLAPPPLLAAEAQEPGTTGGAARAECRRSGCRPRPPGGAAGKQGGVRAAHGCARHQRRRAPGCRLFNRLGRAAGRRPHKGWELFHTAHPALPGPCCCPQELAQDFPRLVRQVNQQKYGKSLRLAGAVRPLPLPLASAAPAAAGVERAQPPCRAPAPTPPSRPWRPFPAVEGLQRYVPAGAQFLLLNGLMVDARDLSLYDLLDTLRAEVGRGPPLGGRLQRASEWSPPSPPNARV